MNRNELNLLRDVIDIINTLRNPKAWETMDHKLIVKEINRAINGLRLIKIDPVDLRKASQAMSYGEPKLAYQYLFETSFPRAHLASQFNASIGPPIGRNGAFNDLKQIFLAESKRNLK